VQQLEGLAEKYVAVVAQNAALHNEVQDLKGSIRVFCRVRPAGTTGDDSPPCTSASVDGEVRDVIWLEGEADNVQSHSDVLLGAARSGICACWSAVWYPVLRRVCMTLMQLAIDVRGQQKLFKYDSVFGDRASQAQVYEKTKPLVRSVLDGEPRMEGFTVL
jgi:Microtubule binding